MYLSKFDFFNKAFQNVVHHNTLHGHYTFLNYSLYQDLRMVYQFVL